MNFISQSSHLYCPACEQLIPVESLTVDGFTGYVYCPHCQTILKEVEI